MREFSFGSKHKALPISRVLNQSGSKNKKFLQQDQIHIQQILRPLQAQGKRTISQPNDHYEQEADRVADQVMRMPEPKVQRLSEAGDEVVGAVDQAKPLTSRLVLRQAIFPTKENPNQRNKVTAAVQARINALQGTGQPLPDSELAFFEPRFGHNFSVVRIHRGAEASLLNRALKAQAFTYGPDVFFKSDSYNPHSVSSKRLLAHELTHVVQQHEGRGRLLQRQPAPVDEFAPKSPQGQAREDVANALLTASRKLDQAIKARNNNGVLPADVFKAYGRFFPGSDLEKLDLLKTRVDDATQWIQTIPFDPIPNPVPPLQRDVQIHNAGLAMAGLHALAVHPGMTVVPGIPAPTDTYIAIYPSWDTAGAMQAPVILHELFHFFPGVEHTTGAAPTEPPLDNARAYQGFVGTLAGLTEGAVITAMFPP